MSKIIIDGGNRLYGDVNISPAKNACLPIISASIAFCGEVVIENAPRIADVEVMAQIVKDFGGNYAFCQDGLYLNTENVNRFIGSRSLYEKVRASLFTAGALLTRFKKAFIPFPGGCKIGARPIDIHISALKSLGVVVTCDEGGVWLDGEKMTASRIDLKYPSVGATVNSICAALGLKGETVIVGAALEPEISDMIDFLKKCGYDVSRNGSSVRVRGRSTIPSGKVFYRPIFDRIEAGTYAFACLACGGGISFKYDCYKYIDSALSFIRNCGGKTYLNGGEIIIESHARPKAQKSIIADVFPAFPTDLQPQAAAVLSTASGNSTICDKVFPERFSYAEMLDRFGARTFGRRDYMEIDGVARLHPAKVVACDLRGGAALCIAALTAKGRSEIEQAEVICRGYSDICNKINKLGGHAVIKNSE